MRSVKILITFLMLFSSTVAQDSLNCRLLSNTGSLVNAYGFSIKDNIAFVTSDRFSIVNISDIENPIVIYSDSLTYFINSVFVDSSYAYLAAADDGLIILDISSLESPEIVSHLKTNEYIEEVKVKNNIAYLGTMNHSFLVVDVSDPNNPNEISRIDSNIDDVWGIEIYDSLLFVASEDTGVKIFNISDPSTPYEVGNLDLVFNSTAVDLKLKDNILYVTHPRDLYAFDISDLSTPQLLYYLEGGGGFSIEIENDYAYCISFTQLNVVDISNPSELKLVGFYPIPEVGSDVYVKNNLAYVACQTAGIFFIEFDDLTNIDISDSERKEFLLSQNYPNPFNPTTTINYSVVEHSLVSLKIFDVLGEEVETLINQQMTAGNYKIEFDASTLPSGIYFYRLQSNNFSETKKLILLK